MISYETSPAVFSRFVLYLTVVIDVVIDVALASLSSLNHIFGPYTTGNGNPLLSVCPFPSFAPGSHATYI